MKALINNLLNIIKTLYSLVVYLLIPYVKNSIVSKSNKPISKPYRKIDVDDNLPIVEKTIVYDYKVLLKEYELEHGKPLKPISRRKETNILFSARCPYCGYTLEKIKDRANFSVYKCRNDDCEYYVKNIYSKSSRDRELYDKEPGKFKLRYIYRDFNFTLDDLAPNTPNRPKIDINRALYPLTTIGYILTFYVNYGLSSREVSNVMKDVFGISVSHQTVLNYAQLQLTIYRIL